MRKLFVYISIMVISLCISTQVQAQKNENANHEDSYYLKGAVPEVNGKVVFSKEFNIAGMNQAEVFSRTQQWMDIHMRQNNNKSRVAYTNEEKGQIAANGEKYIVFSNSALALDRTKVIYQMVADCENGKVVLQIKNIRYDYPNEKEIYLAEEWITDKYALSKDQTKLVRGYAKWRRKTVDFVDDINESLQKALSGIGNLKADDGKPEETRKSDAVAIINNNVAVSQPIQEVKSVQPVAKAAAPAINPSIPVAEVKIEDKSAEAPKVETPIVEKPVIETPVVETPVVERPVLETAKPVVETTKSAEVPIVQAPAAPAEAFPELTTDKVQASNGKLVIIIGEDEFNRTTMTANAGGYLSSKDGKKFIHTILTPEQSYQVLQQATDYSVAFYPNGATSPSIVMKCKNVTTEKPGDGRANIFVGEIISVETR